MKFTRRVSFEIGARAEYRGTRFFIV